MSTGKQLQPVSDQELAAELAHAIRSSAGGRMTRDAELFLAGLCAEHLVDRLALAGFVVMRPRAGPPPPALLDPGLLDMKEFQ